MSTTNSAPATTIATPAATAAETAPASASTSASTLAAPATSTHRRRSSLLSEEQQAYLERRLANRPDPESLQQAGIIKSGGRFAAQQAALQRELHQDALARSLDSRPSIDTLVDAGIIQGGVAPGLQAVAKKLERDIIANTLNQKLYAREDPETLAAQRATLFRGDNVAPRLRDAKIRLEHALTRDHVGHLLESRPDPYDLVRSNVAPPTHISSRIAGAQRQLQHNMTTDRLGHLLERRASLDALQNQNILKDVRIAPALQGPQRALERNLAKANLYHALQHRPTISELKQRGVYPDTYEPYYDEEPQTRAYSHSASAPSYEPSGYQRRSKNFHLTRILLKFVATMAEAGEISLQQKGYLKDLIVDQDKTILAVAEAFDAENDLHDFKDSLVRLASRR